MTAEHAKRPTRLLWWPVRALWRCVTPVSNRLGIVWSLLLGILCVIIGLALIGSIKGMLLGLPLLAFGVFLFVRGII